MTELTIVGEYPHLVVRILPYNSGGARIQLFQDLPKTDAPLGSPVVDFVLTREGCQKLVTHLAEFLGST